jgi:hypothetical protein
MLFGSTTAARRRTSMTEMTDQATTDAVAAGAVAGEPVAGEADELPIVRPAHTARITASVFISATAVVAVAAGWQEWGSDAGHSAHVRAVTLEWAWLVGLLLSGVAFAAWLLRARLNSGRICAAPQRLRARWAVGAWLVPVMNLWWPRVVLVDVWRASNPDVPPVGADLRAVRPGRLIDVWWITSLLGHTIAAIGVLWAPHTCTTLAGAALAVVSAASVLYVMRRVDRWQTGRDAVR